MTAEPTTQRRPADSGYRHEAVLWSGVTEFVDTTAAFVREGLSRGEPVMVATVGPRLDALRSELGEQSASVRFADMHELGSNPARIMQAWLDFIRDADGVPARGVGEPVWAGRRAAEVAECQLHEALLNVAIPASAPLWLRCPYELGALGEDAIAEACRTHPTAMLADGTHVRPGYAGDELSVVAFAEPLDVPVDAQLLVDQWFGAGGLREVRLQVRSGLLEAGVDRNKADDVALAVHELGANSVQHGGGRGRLRLWRQDEAVVCEVQDSGEVSDPLAGRLAPDVDGGSGRGLWMVNHLCDLVQLRSGSQGTTVRLHTWL